VRNLLQEMLFACNEMEQARNYPKQNLDIFMWEMDWACELERLKKEALTEPPFRFIYDA
jgi:hypothetical protein